LLERRSPDTPVVVGRNVGREAEDLTITTLEALDPDSIDMGCLLIIGSSQTRRSHGSVVWTSRSQTAESINDGASHTDETPQNPQRATPAQP